MTDTVLQFNSASTAKPSKDEEGFELTGFARGHIVVTTLRSKKEIRFDINLPNKTTSFTFYWTDTSIKSYKGTHTGNGILFIGMDEEKNYAETEIAFGKDSSMMVFFRSPANNRTLVFMNLASNTKKTTPENNKMVGCWFVRHDATSTARFFSNGTCRFSENGYSVKSGTYGFQGETIRIVFANGTNETWRFYIEPHDQTWHMRKLLPDGSIAEYVKDTTCD